MPSISLVTARAYALVAGFQDPSIILAIAQAESGLNPLAANKNADGSLDRGILQINNRWHAEVTDAQAYDPRDSFVAGYRISKGGTDYTPWSTYTNGAYKQYLAQSTGAEKNSYFAPNPDFNWIFLSPDLTLTYVPHWARDVQESQSWPLTALVPGTVTDLDDSGTVGGGIGCQIFIIPDAYPVYPGSVIKPDWKPSDGGVDPQQPTNVGVIPQPKYGRLAWYSYHFLPGTAVVKNGEHVQAGQKLAMTSNYGGQDPFNHAHVGWFYNWAQETDAGFRPYGPDILSFLNYIVSSHGNYQLGNEPPPGSGGFAASGGGTGILSPLSDTYLAFSLRAHDTITHVPGMAGMVEAVDQAEQFAGIISVQDGKTTPTNPPPWWEQAAGILNPLGPISGIAQGVASGVAGGNDQQVLQQAGQALINSQFGPVRDAVQSLLMTVTANFLPAVIRSALFLTGLTLIILLIIRASKPAVDTALKVGELAA